MAQHNLADHGHHARSPSRIPVAGWKEILVRTWNQSWLDNVGLVAAGVAFYAFLAIVPLLGMIVLIYGVFVEPATVVRNMEALMAVLPNDVALGIGQQLMTAVQSSTQTKGWGIAVALAFAFYGGSNGAGAVMTALNITYQEKEKRSLWRFYLTAFVITLAAVAIALLALAATAVIAELEALVPNASRALVAAAKGFAYFFLVIVAAAVAATLYRYGPSREQARWEWITPGSLFAAVSWILLTVLFGFYVTRVADYSATYGSIGAMIALLTYIYLSAYVFVFGAELNSEIEHQTAEDSTTGEPQPMGQRGAWAADNVAEDTDAKPSPSLADASGATEQQERAKEEEREEERD